MKIFMDFSFIKKSVLNFINVTLVSEKVPAIASITTGNVYFMETISCQNSISRIGY